MKKSGFLEFADDLKKLSRAIESPKVREEACEAGAEVLAEEAKRLAPYKTGELRDSIVHEYEKADRASYVGWGGELNVGPSAHGYYGYFHEFGTYKMKPRPHMRPAMQNKGDAALDAMIKVYQKEME